MEKVKPSSRRIECELFLCKGEIIGEIHSSIHKRTCVHNKEALHKVTLSAPPP